MIGALAGDIIGSAHEFGRTKSKRFELFAPGCRFTDDSVLTVALADAIISGREYGPVMKEYFRRYPRAGYGGMFAGWALSKSSEPYGSFGNGAAMRISPAGWAYDTLDDVLARAREYTCVTHDHPEGIRGAQATAAAVFLCRTGVQKPELKRYIETAFGYDLSRRLDDIRPHYSFDETCQGTVPEALISFLESESYEDAVRNAVSLGGDSDTLGCITGGIAEAFYGLPDDIRKSALSILDPRLRETTEQFVNRYCGNGLPRQQGT